MLKISGVPEVYAGDKIAAKAGVDTTTTGVITGITEADPGVVSDTAHGLSTGDVVRIEDVVGMTEVNDTEFQITRVDADSFSIGVDTTGYTEYTSGGTWTKVEADEATVTLVMDGSVVSADSFVGIDTYWDIAVGDWAITRVTDDDSNTGAADWFIVSAADFLTYYRVNGG